MSESTETAIRHWPPRPLLAALGVSIALVLLHAINASGLSPFGRPVGLFDLNAEHNLPTWWATVQLFTIALLLAVVGYRTSGSERWAAWLAASTAALLSLDEFAQLHERIAVWLRSGVAADDALPVTGIWPLLLGSAVGAASLAIGWLGRRLWTRDPAAAVLLAVGVLTLIGSAAGLELLINLIPPDSPILPWQIALEELGELIGAWLMLWAAWRYASAAAGRLNRGASGPGPRVGSV